VGPASRPAEASGLIGGPYSESGSEEPGTPGSFPCRVLSADKIDVPNVRTRAGAEHESASAARQRGIRNALPRRTRPEVDRRIRRPRAPVTLSGLPGVRG